MLMAPLSNVDLLVLAVSDPSFPRYGHHYSMAAARAEFVPAADDLLAVYSMAQMYPQLHYERWWDALVVRGAAQDMEQVFGIALYDWEHHACGGRGPLHCSCLLRWGGRWSLCRDAPVWREPQLWLPSWGAGGWGSVCVCAAA